MTDTALSNARDEVTIRKTDSIQPKEYQEQNKLKVVREKESHAIIRAWDPVGLRHYFGSFKLHATERLASWASLAHGGVLYACNMHVHLQYGDTVHQIIRKVKFVPDAREINHVGYFFRRLRPPDQPTVKRTKKFLRGLSSV